MPTKYTPLEQYAAIEQRIARDEETGCWNWTGHLNRGGYGKLSSSWTGESIAHRYMWIRANGPIPDGLYPDHLCRNRRCVNPSHIELVTFKENVLRGIGPTAINAAKSHCTRGHEFTPENTMDSGGGGRKCRPCHNAYVKWKHRKKRAGEWPAAEKWNGEFA